MTLANGKIVDRRYRIIELLGEGGFGAVYKAWDLNRQRLCALKENHDTSTASQNQFRREAEMLARLEHPNLPRVTDHFLIPGEGQYLVMDFVEGHDLREVLAQAGRPVPEARVLEWARQICDALIYLHGQTPPIIHRDIKPANIRLTAQGAVFLVDFGLAKIFAAEAATTAGARGASRGYSPPEQFAGGRTDGRSDLYALGATLYNLLTGQVPVESMRRLLNDPLVPPRRLNPEISPRIEQVILRAMAPQREDRFQSVVALRRALAEAPRGTRPVAPPHSAESAAPKSRRNLWVIVAIVAAALLFAVCACGGVLWLLLRQGHLGPLTPSALLLPCAVPLSSLRLDGVGTQTDTVAEENGPPGPASGRSE